MPRLHGGACRRSSTSVEAGRAVPRHRRRSLSRTWWRPTGARRGRPATASMATRSPRRTRADLPRATTAAPRPPGPTRTRRRSPRPRGRRLLDARRGSADTRGRRAPRKSRIGTSSTRVEKELYQRFRHARGVPRNPSTAGARRTTRSGRPRGGSPRVAPDSALRAQVEGLGGRPALQGHQEVLQPQEVLQEARTRRGSPPRRASRRSVEASRARVDRRLLGARRGSPRRLRGENKDGEVVKAQEACCKTCKKYA